MNKRRSNPARPTANGAGVPRPRHDPTSARSAVPCHRGGDGGRLLRRSQTRAAAHLGERLVRHAVRLPAATTSTRPRSISPSISRASPYSSPTTRANVATVGAPPRENLRSTCVRKHRPRPPYVARGLFESPPRGVTRPTRRRGARVRWRGFSRRRRRLRRSTRPPRPRRCPGRPGPSPPRRAAGGAPARRVCGARRGAAHLRP